MTESDEVPTLKTLLVVDAKSCLGEGPLWHPGRCELLWLDILQAKVFCYSPEKDQVTIEIDLSSVTKYVTTIVPVEGSLTKVLVGLAEGFALLDLDRGVESLDLHRVNGTLYGEYTRMNDGKCDPQGRLWIGSMSREGHDEAEIISRGGSLFCLKGWDNAPVKILDDVTVSNGLAWSADSQTMYYIDSLTFGIDAFDFDDGAGHITNRRRCITVSNGFPPAPDGCCLDTEGMIWVACFGGGCVHRYNPCSGALLATVKLPLEAGNECTACAFGGPRLDELYVTCAHEFWPADKLAQFPLAGGLFKVTREELSEKLGRSITGAQTNFFRMCTGP